MRWTLPTLIDTLYRNGLDLDLAGEIVGNTYYVTQGDENFSVDAQGPSPHLAVGPYAVWESIRGVYPQDAPTHAGADARSLVAALRGSKGTLDDVIFRPGLTSPVIVAAVQRTVAAIREGYVVTPETVDDSPDQLRQVEHTRRELDRTAGIVGNLFDTMFRQ